MEKNGQKGSAWRPRNSDSSRLLSKEEVDIARVRRLEAMHVQEIEGNPFSPEDVEMFEMFERERWSQERCLEYLRAHTLALIEK